MSNMVSRSFHLTGRQMEGLQEIVDESGLSMSEIMRRAVDHYLAAHYMYLAEQQNERMKAQNLFRPLSPKEETEYREHARRLWDSGELFDNPDGVGLMHPIVIDELKKLHLRDVAK